MLLTGLNCLLLAGVDHAGDDDRPACALAGAERIMTRRPIANAHEPQPCSYSRTKLFKKMGGLPINKVVMQMTEANDHLSSMKMTQYCTKFLTKYHDHLRFVLLFNTGLVVLSPSQYALNRTQTLMLEETKYADSCIGGTGCNDQMILNLYFHEVGAHILPRRYNYVPYRVNPGKECYPPTEVGDGLIFHFTGSSKPWVRETEYEGLVDKGMQTRICILERPPDHRVLT